MEWIAKNITSKILEVLTPIELVLLSVILALCYFVCFLIKQYLKTQIKYETFIIDQLKDSEQEKLKLLGIYERLNYVQKTQEIERN